jgi:hypothetical protein
VGIVSHIPSDLQKKKKINAIQSAAITVTTQAQVEN